MPRIMGESQRRMTWARTESMDQLLVNRTVPYITVALLDPDLDPDYQLATANR